MVPVKLQLRNFMSYRGSNGAIDFSGIHLACLTGDNGHGKSALLDAMTWALWGKARARRDDDLISRGESEMEVHFEFDLGRDRYRIIRKRSTRGRGSSVLELQVRRNSFFVPLSEPAIRETQQKIIDLLRLDYDTFVNSAFLLQGRADEFTTRRPAERKQILGDILRLTIYDTYAERAREKARAAEQEREAVEHELEEIKRWTEAIPELEQVVITSESAANGLGQRLRAEETSLRVLYEHKRELDLKAEQLTEAERQATDAEHQMLDLQRRIAERQARIRRYDDLLVRTDAIEAGYEQLLAARRELEHWGEVTQQLMALQSEQGTVQRALDAARAQLESELKVAERTATDLRPRALRVDEMRTALTQAQAELAHLESLQREHQRQLLDLQQAREESAARAQENSHLKELMNSLRERLDLLEHEEGVLCPVCRQPLSPEHRDEVLKDVQREGTELGNRYRQNWARMQALSDEISRRVRIVEEAEGRLRQLGHWQGQVARLEQALTEAGRAALDLERAEQSAAALHQRLAAKDYALDIQERLAQLDQTVAALGYNRALHEQARQRARELQAFDGEHNELCVARERRNDEQTMVGALQQQVGVWQARLGQIQAEIADLRHMLARRAELARQAEEQLALVTDLQRQATEAQRRLGAARQRLEFAEQQAAKLPEKLRELDAWTEERTIFTQLQYAFSKRGIQAMLIETAIPEIEDEANALLARMSDGRMSVRIETQREGKTTDTPIETLDIIIADEQGERPYELFSGGEAFRINFALRIALSKLLARRAGARLQTLVMDEGFGTQDAQGRERLVEAITAVQHDFERILVITHLDELKDAFPVRIDVIKGPNGSTVTIN
ncbi:MAG TPA: chromosome segregation protein SMC [Chloroflexi bacterium]|nr:chromosome segregation protein SMC [Chloroflexota bacterium]